MNSSHSEIHPSVHFSGCYKREDGVSFVHGKVQAKTDNRPETFYFGELDQDVDACEAACKDQPDCVAYTLYKVSIC